MSPFISDPVETELPVADPQDAATVLEEAADLLLIRGRCTGVGTDPNGRLCVRGALAAARGDDPTDNLALYSTFTLDVLALDRHLAAAFFPKWTSPDRGAWVDHVGDYGQFPAHVWNDQLRDEDGDFEVIDTLRRVAKDIRNAR